VADDGVGFDAGAVGESGYGMRSMAERAELVGGHLQVVSEPGSGTRVIVTVPADRRSDR
jgi:two-component system, NarL family, sensor kinase